MMLEVRKYACAAVLLLGTYQLARRFWRKHRSQGLTTKNGKALTYDAVHVLSTQLPLEVLRECFWRILSPDARRAFRASCTDARSLVDRDFITKVCIAIDAAAMQNIQLTTNFLNRATSLNSLSFKISEDVARQHTTPNDFICRLLGFTQHNPDLSQALHSVQMASLSSNWPFFSLSRSAINLLVVSLPNLRHLHIQKCVMAIPHIAIISQCLTLETLHLSDMEMPGGDLVSAMATLPDQLTHLSLIKIFFHYNFGIFPASSLHHLTALQSLTLSGMPVSHPEALSNLTSLTSLRIDAPRTEEGVIYQEQGAVWVDCSFLAALKQLQSLHLAPTGGFKPRGWEHVKELTQLTYLGLGFGYTVDLQPQSWPQGAQPGLPSVRELVIQDHPPLHDAHFIIHAAANIQRLTIDAVAMPREMGEDVQALRISQLLREVLQRCADVESYCGGPVPWYCGALDNPQTLTLQFCRNRYRSMQSVLSALEPLRGSSKVQQLVLAGVPALDREGVAAAVEALPQLTSVVLAQSGAFGMSGCLHPLTGLQQLRRLVIQDVTGITAAEVLELSCQSRGVEVEVKECDWWRPYDQELQQRLHQAALP